MRPLGESAMPFGRPVGLRHQRHRAFGRDVIHAVEIQFAVSALLAESRIGEVDVPVARHHDLVRRIQRLPSQRSASTSILPFLSVRVTRRVRVSQVYSRPCASKALPRGTVRIRAEDLDLARPGPISEAGRSAYR